MATMILDSLLEQRLRNERAASGADRYDEVWEGVYMMAPMPNNEHQLLATDFAHVLSEIVRDRKLGVVFAGVNISDRVEEWEHNYRVPDVAVFLKNTTAVNRGTFWQGGPDFAVEIVSPHDQSREKLGFYGAVGTREVLIVDRDPWQLELYRLDGQVLRLVGSVRVDEGSIDSDVLGLTICLKAGNERPKIEVRHDSIQKTWTI